MTTEQLIQDVRNINRAIDEDNERRDVLIPLDIISATKGLPPYDRDRYERVITLAEIAPNQFVMLYQDKPLAHTLW